MRRSRRTRLRIRKRTKEAFGWAKTIAGLRNARRRRKIDWRFTQGYRI